MDSDKKVTAIFDRIDVTIEGEGKMKYEIMDSGSSPRVVRIWAVPDEVWEFEKWDGDYQGTENPIEFVPYNREKLIAYFSKIPKEFDGPEIVSFTFSPEVVDVTEKDAVVTIRIHVTDVSGIKQERVGGYISLPGNVSGTQLSNEFELISGTNRDGLSAGWKSGWPDQETEQKKKKCC